MEWSEHDQVALASIHRLVLVAVLVLGVDKLALDPVSASLAEGHLPALAVVLIARVIWPVTARDEV